MKKIALLAGLAGLAGLTTAGLAACGGKAQSAADVHNPAGSSDKGELVVGFTPKTFSVKVSGAGRPVLFIPGLSCSGAVWDGTVAHLGGKVQAHVLTLAGFGGQAPITDPLLPNVKSEIIAYVKANHLDHPMIVGHSLGGFMAFWLLESEPDLFSGAVAVDGAPFFPGLQDPDAKPEQFEARAKAFQGMLAQSTPEQFADGSRQMMASMITKPADLDRMSAISVKSDPRTVGDAMYFLMTTDLRPDLGKITKPVTEIAADGGTIPKDKLEATWKAEIAGVPKHELVIVPNSKHFIMLDQPEAFYSALDKALAK